MSVEVFFKTLGIYALLLSICGTICNSLIFLTTRQIKQQNTFIYLRFLAVSDLLSLFYWNLDKFISTWSGFSYQSMSMSVCKVGTWLQYTTLQYSSWMLVVLALDRYLCVHKPNWMRFLTQTKAFVLSYAVLLFCSLINSNLLFTLGIMKESENSSHLLCHSIDQKNSNWIEIWGRVHALLYSFIPCILLAIINLFFLCELYVIRNKLNTISPATVTTSVHAKKKNSITMTVIVLTVIYIICTAPAAYVEFNLLELLERESGRILLALSDALAFSYHALNFFILYNSNQRFKTKLKEVFSDWACQLRKIKVMSKCIEIKMRFL